MSIKINIDGICISIARDGDDISIDINTRETDDVDLITEHADDGELTDEDIQKINDVLSSPRQEYVETYDSITKKYGLADYEPYGITFASVGKKDLNISTALDKIKSINVEKSNINKIKTFDPLVKKSFVMNVRHYGSQFCNTSSLLDITKEVKRTTPPASTAVNLGSS